MGRRPEKGQGIGNKQSSQAGPVKAVQDNTQACQVLATRANALTLSIEVVSSRHIFDATRRLELHCSGYETEWSCMEAIVSLCFAGPTGP